MFSGTTTFGPTAAHPNPNKDTEVPSPPDDTVTSLRFSPSPLPQTYLLATSWDNHVRCWEVTNSGLTPKAQQSHGGPVMDACWSNDGTKVFTCSVDKTANMWDLQSNSFTQIAAHDAPIKTIHCIQSPTYTCVMTGSWDKTLKFWDTRSNTPMLALQLPERCYCAAVHYPLAVVGTAGRHVLIYNLDKQPSEFKRMESPLKFQSRCLSIFLDKGKTQPNGFALGSIEGRVAIQYLNPVTPKDNFTFKCHRSNGGTSSSVQDIYAVNDMAFHPVHGTMATVGSDGKYIFWDKDARTKLKGSESMDLPITSCGFDGQGQIFAYAVGYDWSKGHDGFDPNKKPRIYLRACMEELKATQRK